MNNYNNILKINAIIFTLVLIIGGLSVIGGLLYSSYKSTYPGCHTDYNMELTSGSDNITSVKLVSKDILIVNLGNEIIIVNLCKNQIVKRLKIVPETIAEQCR